MEKLNLYQKIVELRKSIPFLKKDTKSFKYKYVSGVAILSIVQDKMNELGLLLIPTVLNKKSVIEGNNKIVEADMIWTWIDADTGEKLEISWALFGEQNDISKAFGSALTYSERYFLLKALNIPTDEDDPDYIKHKSNTQTTTSIPEKGFDTKPKKKIESWEEFIVRKKISNEDIKSFKAYIAECASKLKTDPETLIYNSTIACDLEGLYKNWMHWKEQVAPRDKAKSNWWDDDNHWRFRKKEDLKDLILFGFGHKVINPICENNHNAKDCLKLASSETKKNLAIRYDKLFGDSALKTLIKSLNNK